MCVHSHTQKQPLNTGPISSIYRDPSALESLLSHWVSTSWEAPFQRHILVLNSLEWKWLQDVSGFHREVQSDLEKSSLIVTSLTPIRLVGCKWILGSCGEVVGTCSSFPPLLSYVPLLFPFYVWHSFHFIFKKSFTGFCFLEPIIIDLDNFLWILRVM